MFKRLNPALQYSICRIVALTAKKPSVTLEESEDIYNSEKYPDMNRDIEYIIELDWDNRLGNEWYE